jgi:hypothetical protein
MLLQRRVILAQRRRRHASDQRLYTTARNDAMLG